MILLNPRVENGDGDAGTDERRAISADSLDTPGSRVGRRNKTWIGLLRLDQFHRHDWGANHDVRIPIDVIELTFRDIINGFKGDLGSGRESGAREARHAQRARKRITGGME